MLASASRPVYQEDAAQFSDRDEQTHNVSLSRLDLIDPQVCLTITIQNICMHFRWSSMYPCLLLNLDLCLVSPAPFHYNMLKVGHANHLHDL